MGFEYKHADAMEKQREAMRSFLRSQGKPTPPALVDLACFKKVPFAHPLKGEFCIALALHRWPNLYVEKDGIENYWFTTMQRVLCKYKRVFMVGSASAGKTFGASVWGMNMWASYPNETTFLVTSTDKESLDSKAWGTIRDLHKEDKLQIGVRVDYEDAIVLKGKANERDIRDAIKAIALPKGSEGQKAIAKVQGRKNSNILWLADEYADMDGFVKKARGNLRMARSFHFVACSNRPEEGDPMHQDAMPDPDKYPLGWETPGLSDLTMWETKGGGICLYFDGEKSPNTLAAGDEDPFPMLTRRDAIRETREQDGEDSFEWWKYIKAFPRAGQAHDKLIDSKFITRYKADEDVTWAGPQWEVVAGLDAAWTKGGDSCMADFGKVGIDHEGTKVLFHEPEAVKLNTKVSGAGTFEEQLADVFLEECQKRNCHVVAIDISGSGGRLANPVIRKAQEKSWKLEVISVDSAGSPDEEEMYEVGSIQKNGKQLFKKRMDEIWVSYRLSVQRGLIRGMKVTSKAFREMSDRRIDTDEDKRWVLEAKDEYKKRNSGRSPDSAEARVLAHYAARKHGLGASVIPKQSSQKVTLGIGGPDKKPSPYGWGRGGKAAYSY